MQTSTRFLAAMAFVVALSGCGGDAPLVPDPTISISDVSVAEGEDAVFTVSVAPTSAGAVTFDYSTANGTAVAPGDYTAAAALSGSISAGAGSTTITITTTDDATSESSETFTVTLSSVSGAELGDLSATGTIEASDVSFASDVQPILTSQCASCHSTATSGGLNMGNPISWSGVRNGSGDHGSIVIAGNATASNLYLKVTSTPPFGVRMPQGGPFLSTTDQEKIRRWINEGALNN
jgi:hypothetical protein